MDALLLAVFLLGGVDFCFVPLDAAAQKSETAYNAANLADPKERYNEEDAGATVFGRRVRTLEQAEGYVSCDARESRKDQRLIMFFVAASEIAKNGGANEGYQLRRPRQRGSNEVCAAAIPLDVIRGPPITRLTISVLDEIRIGEQRNEQRDGDRGSAGDEASQIAKADVGIAQAQKHRVEQQARVGEHRPIARLVLLFHGEQIAPALVLLAREIAQAEHAGNGNSKGHGTDDVEGVLDGLTRANASLLEAGGQRQEDCKGEQSTKACEHANKTG
ncbi:hypothetical protein MPH_08868 [Macrophomina phaseolina MS6]|uniref:Uncharacterized protein n=1 Tax=Macrophomina phaseolina (strain MS6) TaxID=1126212 RepID=K2RUZ9_MACPH|nr:hypothetical protein MPH_08868 [Macrophomina phaseolina MS6]